jgi:hypothetical protein
MAVVAQKIAAEGGMVKSYTRTDKGLKVTFTELFFANGHTDVLDDLIDEHRKVRVTIESVEKRLTDGLKG